MAEREWYVSDEKLKATLSQTERLRNGMQIYECTLTGDYAAFEAALTQRGIATVRDRASFEAGSAAKCYFDEQLSTYYITKYALDKKLGAHLGAESSIERGIGQNSIPRVMVTQF